MVHWELKGFACAALAAMALACGGGVVAESDRSTMGAINLSVRFITTADGLPVTKIHVGLVPANVVQDLTFDEVTEEFSGVITSPPGTQTITATAFSGSIVLGSGTATTTVAKHVTATVLIKILDTASPGRNQDHGPIILSITASPTSAMVGDTVRLEASATDPDGDPISYQWNQDCTGTFSAPFAAATDWTTNTAQSCSIALLATARGITDSRRISMTVQAASGTVSLTTAFIPAPYVTEFDLAAPGLACTVPRDIADASCRPAIPGGTVLTATISFDPMPADSGGNVVLTDGCGGGGGTRTGLDLPSGRATFTWTAPAITGSCLLTATASRETLSDAQKVAVAIQ